MKQKVVVYSDYKEPSWTKRNEKTINEIIFVVSFMAVFYFTTLFWVGFHNMDLGQNFKYLSEVADLELNDLGIDFITRTPNEMYILGVNQFRNAFFGILISSLIFGYQLKEVLDYGKKTII
jgi:hypothetical protein